MRVLPYCRAEADPEEDGMSQAGTLLPQQTDRLLAAPAYFLFCRERGSEVWSQPYQHLSSPEPSKSPLTILSDLLTLPFLPQTQMEVRGTRLGDS